MRTVEILQILGASVGAFASIVAAMEQGFVKRLRRNGATSAETAIKIAGLRPVVRWRLERLKKRDAVRSVASGAVYLHEPTYRTLRRKRAGIAVSVMVVAVAVIVAVHGAGDP